MNKQKEPERIRGTWGPKYKRKILWEGKPNDITNAMKIIYLLKFISVVETGKGQIESATNRRERCILELRMGKKFGKWIIVLAVR